MNMKPLGIMLAGLLALTVLAGCSSSQQGESQNNQSDVPVSTITQTSVCADMNANAVCDSDETGTNQPAVCPDVNGNEICDWEEQATNNCQAGSGAECVQDLPDGCASPSGYSTTTGESCDINVLISEAYSDKVGPVPEGANGYSYGQPLNADETTQWFAPGEGMQVYVNTVSHPFWVCGESSPDSGIAGWCSHYYNFQYNSFEGWSWQGVGSGTQRIQLRADWDNTMIYMTTVPLPPQCVDCAYG